MILQKEIHGLITKVNGNAIDNRLNFDQELTKFNKTEIRIRGSRNNIIIGKEASLDNIKIEIKGSNNKIYIGSNTSIRGHLLVKGKNQCVSIGDRTTFKNVYILSSEGKNVEIGEDCMFSYDIAIRTTDAHSIIDLETGKRTNHANDVVIGNHVWIAAGVLVSKGAVIPDDCVIGGRAVVTKVFSEPHCVIAGSPAKIVKRNITWARELL